MRDGVRDCIIIGGGASGLFAASYLTYLDPDIKLTIVEKMPRVGKKLLLTGSGRCNITNASTGKDDYNTDNVARLDTVLKSFAVNETVEFFENYLGLVLTSKDELYYPLTFRSNTVLDCLRFYIEERGVETILEDPVTKIAHSNNGYSVLLDSGKLLEAGNIIFACGGKSFAKTGSDGSAIDLLKTFVKDEDIIPYKPALVPLTSDKPGIKSLAGVRFNGSIDILSDGTNYKRAEGEILFTKDGGLSGIAVLDVSDAARELIDKGRSVSASLNLTGKGSGDILRMLFIRRQLFPSRTVSNCFSGLLNRVLLDAVLKDIKIDGKLIASSISDQGLIKLSNTIAGWLIPITGTKGFEDAQVSAGGVRLSSLTDKLEYSNSRGLYVIGEAVNVNGICGGFNLQWAWSSAVAAARGIRNV